MQTVKGRFLLNLVITASLFVFAAWGATNASASPWTRPQGEGLAISQTSYFTSRQDVSSDGEIVSQRFERFETDLYLEYGLTSSITIGGKAVYGASRLNRGDIVETASGVSEYGGFAQYQVLRNDRDAIAIRIGASSASSLDDGARAGTANDGVDADIALLYGRNFTIAPFGVFAAADVGYRRRFGDAADQIRMQADIGVKPGKRWMILVQSFGEFSLGNETNGGSDFDIVKINPSVVRRFGDPEKGRWSLQVGYSEEIAGRNVALGRRAFLSIWTAF